MFLKKCKIRIGLHVIEYFLPYNLRKNSTNWGVWVRHWRPEFMKQVFPMLTRPTTPGGRSGLLGLSEWCAVSLGSLVVLTPDFPLWPWTEDEHRPYRSGGTYDSISFPLRTQFVLLGLDEDSAMVEDTSSHPLLSARVAWPPHKLALEFFFILCEEPEVRTIEIQRRLPS